MPYRAALSGRLFFCSFFLSKRLKNAHTKERNGGVGMKKGCGWICYWAAVFVLACSPAEEYVPAGGGVMVEMTDGIPVVALTFDDGPHPEHTRRLMEGLAAREVPATFFLVGERLAGNEGIVRELAVQGHQIGVHTWDHVMLDEDVSTYEFRSQMLRVRQGIRDIIGEGDYWLRPPYGIMTPELQKLEEGPLIIWSVDPEDWKDRNKERIVNYVLTRVRDGDIILMHDMFGTSVDAALEIVDELQGRGYCFVTVKELMALRGVEPEAGRRYNSVPP